MEKEDAPLNVTAFDELGRMDETPALPFRGKAMDIAVTGKSDPPKTLEIRSRKASPPMVARMVCRRVVLRNTTVGSVKGEGGRF